MKLIKIVLFFFTVLGMTSEREVFAQATPPVIATLQATVSKQVLQDEIKLTFTREATGKTAAEVNRLLADSLEQAKASLKGMTGFVLSSGHFRTSQSYNKDGRAEGWRGRAELILTSTELIAAQTAAGVLGTTLALSNVQFSLSVSTRIQEEQALLKEVAQSFRARAQAAASAFGYTRYQIVSLDLNGLGSIQTPLLMRSSGPMSAPVSEPIKFSFDPGLVQVTVDVSGKVTFN